MIQLYGITSTTLITNMQVVQTLNVSVAPYIRVCILSLFLHAHQGKDDTSVMFLFFEHVFLFLFIDLVLRGVAVSGTECWPSF